MKLKSKNWWGLITVPILTIPLFVSACKITKEAPNNESEIQFTSFKEKYDNHQWDHHVYDEIKLRFIFNLDLNKFAFLTNDIKEMLYEKRNNLVIDQQILNYLNLALSDEYLKKETKYEKTNKVFNKDYFLNDYVTHKIQNKELHKLLKTHHDKENKPSRLDHLLNDNLTVIYDYAYLDQINHDDKNENDYFNTNNYDTYDRINYLSDDVNFINPSLIENERFKKIDDNFKTWSTKRSDILKEIKQNLVDTPIEINSFNKLLDEIVHLYKFSNYTENKELVYRDTSNEFNRDIANQRNPYLSLSTYHTDPSVRVIKTNDKMTFLDKPKEEFSKLKNDEWYVNNHNQQVNLSDMKNDATFYIHKSNPIFKRAKMTVKLNATNDINNRIVSFLNQENPLFSSTMLYANDDEMIFLSTYHGINKDNEFQLDNPLNGVNKMLVTFNEKQETWEINQDTINQTTILHKDQNEDQVLWKVKTPESWKQQSSYTLLRGYLNPIKLNSDVIKKGLTSYYYNPKMFFKENDLLEKTKDNQYDKDYVDNFAINNRVLIDDYTDWYDIDTYTTRIKSEPNAPYSPSLKGVLNYSESFSTLNPLTNTHQEISSNLFVHKEMLNLEELNKNKFDQDRDTTLFKVFKGNFMKSNSGVGLMNENYALIKKTRNEFDQFEHNPNILKKFVSQLETIDESNDYVYDELKYILTTALTNHLELSFIDRNLINEEFYLFRPINQNIINTYDAYIKEILKSQQ